MGFFKFFRDDDEKTEGQQMPAKEKVKKSYPQTENAPVQASKPSSEDKNIPVQETPKTFSQPSNLPTQGTKTIGGKDSSHDTPKEHSIIPPSGSYSVFDTFDENGYKYDSSWTPLGKNSYVKCEEINLTVFLIENTEEVAKQKDKLERIVKNLASKGLIVTINHGSLVRESDKVEAEGFDVNELLYQEDLGEKSCLFDALVVLEAVVTKYYQKMDWKKFKRVKINKIDVIGIGTGIDNASVVSMEKGIESFEKVLKLEKITTKYFCINEEDFISVATIGFRSIGAIMKN